MVSISLLVAMIGLSQWIWGPSVARVVPQFFAGHKLNLGPTTVTYHQLITIGVAVVVAIGLRLLLYRTRLGVGMRAVVDDRPLALLNGARSHLIAQASWAIGTSLAALGGILVASTAGLSATVLSLLIVNAYGAAVFGRLRSLPLTFVGAIVLGCLDGYLTGYLPSSGAAGPYLAGLRLASPVIMLFIVLLVLPNKRLRSHVRAREFFPAPTTKGLLLFCGLTLAFGLVLTTTLSQPDLLTYSKMFSVGIIALSLVPLVGFAGQISLCQLSFAGIGGLVMAHLGAGGSPLGLVAAVIICALVGGLVALPALRLSGIYLALATAAFAVLLDRWIFVLPDWSWGPLHMSLFASGSINVASLKLFGFTFSTPRSQMLMMVVAFVLVALLVVAIRRGAFGRRLLAIRDSEAACATFGLNLVGTRLAVFMLSAAIAGFGGALYATQLQSISPTNFDFFSGLPIFMMVVVGGAGFVGGALLAGVALQGLLPVMAAIWPWFSNIETMTPGLAGIGLGRQPSGAAPAVQRRVRPAARRHAGAHLDAGGDGRGVGVAPGRPVLGLDHGRAVRRGVRPGHVGGAAAGRRRRVRRRRRQRHRARPRPPATAPAVSTNGAAVNGATASGAVDGMRRRGRPRTARSRSSGWASPWPGPTNAWPRSTPTCSSTPSIWAGAAMSQFEVTGVSVRFGGNMALADVSLTAESGQVVGLIGPNGAGKTTLFNVITGLQPSTEGRVVLGERDITRLSPTKRARLGLARTFQRLELFTMLTVRENIAVAADIHRRWSRAKIDVDVQTAEILERIGLTEVADLRVTALPTGQGRLVEMGRALACDPKVLLLDEPAAGQDDAETERFSALLRQLAGEGVAVILVEHDMKLVMQVCDVIHVLNYGRMLAVGTPDEIRNHDAVREAYLGQPAAQP